MEKIRRLGQPAPTLHDTDVTTMQYHARPHLSVHTRAKAHSAVAGAAYRLGVRLYDERTKQWHDYRKRTLSDSVVRALTVAPHDAPPWATDAAVVWNAVESAERRKDGQVARDYRVPVPLGFDEARAAELAEALARFIAEDLHTPVSVALHRDAARDAFGVLKDDGRRGYHAHLYFPTRPIIAGAVPGAPAFGKKLSVFRDQNTGAEALERLNAKWAELSNLLSSTAGLEVRVDHRSYARMGLLRTPEPALGQPATALERQGVHTRLGDAVLASRAARNAAPPTATTTTGEPLPSVEDMRSLAPAVVTPRIPAARADTPTTPNRVSDATSGASSSTPKLGAPLQVKPRASAAVRRAKYITEEEWLQSPVAWAPRPIVGLASRFDAVYTVRAAKTPAGIHTGVLQLVKAVEWFLNALVTVGKALLHLDSEFKRYSTARFDVLYEADQKKSALTELRKQVDGSRRPYTPRMAAAHRRRLAEVRTIEEEVAERMKLSKSILEQLEDINKRSSPWRNQAIHDRRNLKLNLAELEKLDRQAVDELLEVANADELPWLKLYTSKTEPTLSMQRMVDESKAHEGRTSRSTQRAYRPKK